MSEQERKLFDMQKKKEDTEKRIQDRINQRY